jgi:hypothetical protein
MADPIRIQAEDYVSAVDSDLQNKGGAYRNDYGVDLWASKDIGGGYTVGAVAQGESLTYNLTVPTSGTYNIVARVASAYTGPHTLGVALAGQALTTLNFNGTGGWFTWANTAPKAVTLTAGTYPLRLDILSNTEYNINYIDLIPASPPPPAPALGTGTGLLGEYFNNSNFTAPILTRTDATVNFDWGTGSPNSAIGADTFSVRWSGQVQPLYDGTYTFYTTSDDGVRLYVNNQLVINNWTDHSPTENSGTIALKAGQKYDIRLEYYENGGGAVSKLAWSSTPSQPGGPSQTKQIIPTSQLYTSATPPPAPASGTGTGLLGEYFNNSNFTAPILTRTDATVNFDWGGASPDPNIGPDTFSVRWTGQVEAPSTGNFTFYSTADDGVRLYVNNQLIIDRFVDQAPTESSGTIALVAGQRYDIRMEYYENGGGAVAQLAWAGPGIPKQIIPTSQLYTPATPLPPPPTGDLPGLIGQFVPTRNPVLPSGSDTFNPSFNGAVSSQAPLIAEWTRSAQPGDTIVLSGWKFSNLTGSQFGSDTKFLVYGQSQAGNGVLTEAKLQELSGDLATVTLPTTLPKGSDYLIWAQNSSGASRPVLINDAETWWIGPDQATRGQITSVFGRNLSQDGGTSKSNIYIEDSSGNGSWAEVVSVNPYKIDFRVPQSLANGNYKVWVHNGDGGQYGWSTPLILTINNGINYTGPTINVRDFGARGDGSTDDTQAITNAITVASATPMSTVYFPAGTYILGRTIYGSPGFGKDNIRFQGAGKDLTTLKAKNNFNTSQSNPHLYFAYGASKLTFSDMTLDSNSTQFTAGGNEPGNQLSRVLNIRDSSDIQFLNIRIQANGSGQQITPFDIQGSIRVFVKNSDVIGIAGFLGAASQIFIDGSNFFGSDYGGSSLQGFGTKMLSITNSVGRNLDTTDPNRPTWVNGRLWVDTAIWSNSKYQYIGNNTTIDLAPPNTNKVDQNGGEQILWEEPGSGLPLGSVTESSLSSVTFSSVASGIDGSHLLTITGGKGIGQTRQVKSRTNQTVTIDGSWNVQPDATSIFVARRTPSQIVIYKNALDGLPDYASRVTASTGVQPYFGSADLIVDGNSFNELRSGVNQFTGQTNSGVAASNFTIIRNNSFVDLLNGFNAVLDNAPGATQQTYFLGNTIRDNSFTNVQYPAGIYPYPGLTSGGPYANMNIFERNFPVLSPFPENSNVQNTLVL